jgi:hypothetical protein
VLANLPRARPQRGTPRRAAARERADAARSTEDGPGGGPTVAAARTASSPAAAGERAAGAGRGKRAGAAGSTSTPTPAKARRAAKARAKTAPRLSGRAQQEPVPRQGFASDDDRASGPVQPPGGPELLATAAEIVSELAKAGAGAGERLVRDLFSRLPGS